MAAELTQSWCAFNLGLLLVLLLRGPWRYRFGARASYRLWWLPVLCAAACWIPSGGRELASVRELLLVSTVPLPALRAVAINETNWAQLTWAGGAALIALGFLVTRMRLARHWQRLPRHHDPRCPAVPIVRADFGPALVGLWRPLLVLPTDFEARYDPAQQALVLAHEAAHARGGDLKVRAAMLLLAIAQWWNPIAWLALLKLIEDQELACDARVIEDHPEARATYAHTLCAGALGSHRATAFMCSLHPTHPLLRRIAMLNQPMPGKLQRRWASLLTCVLAVAASAVAWAADNAAPTVVENAHPGLYRVSFALQVDDRPVQSFGLGDRAGKLMQANIRDNGEMIGVEAVVHETATPGQVLLKMHLTRAGKPLGEPAIAVGLDQPGRIEIGEKTGTGFSGVRIDATVIRDQRSANVAPFRRLDTLPVLGVLPVLMQEGEGC